MAAPVPTSRSDGRSERRIPQILAAEISISEESVLKEATVTENVSLHGARLTAVRRWLPDTRVLVTFLRDGLRSEGRVVYCQPKSGRTFAIGIELYPDERKAA
jgi:PilZ domain